MKDVHAHLGHADGAVTVSICRAALDGRVDDLGPKLDVLHEQGQRAATGTRVAREAAK